MELFELINDYGVKYNGSYSLNEFFFNGTEQHKDPQIQINLKCSVPQELFKETFNYILNATIYLDNDLTPSRISNTILSNSFIVAGIFEKGQEEKEYYEIQKTIYITLPKNGYDSYENYFSTILNKQFILKMKFNTTTKELIFKNYNNDKLCCLSSIINFKTFYFNKDNNLSSFNYYFSHTEGSNQNIKNSNQSASGWSSSNGGAPSSNDYVNEIIPEILGCYTIYDYYSSNFKYKNNKNEEIIIQSQPQIDFCFYYNHSPTLNELNNSKTEAIDQSEPHAYGAKAKGVILDNNNQIVYKNYNYKNEYYYNGNWNSYYESYDNSNQTFFIEQNFTEMNQTLKDLSKLDIPIGQIGILSQIIITITKHKIVNDISTSMPARWETIDPSDPYGPSNPIYGVGYVDSQDVYVSKPIYLWIPKLVENNLMYWQFDYFTDIENKQYSIYYTPYPSDFTDNPNYFYGEGITKIYSSKNGILKEKLLQENIMFEYNNININEASNNHIVEMETHFYYYNWNITNRLLRNSKQVEVKQINKEQISPQSYYLYPFVNLIDKNNLQLYEQNGLKLISFNTKEKGPWHNKNSLYSFKDNIWKECYFQQMVKVNNKNNLTKYITPWPQDRGLSEKEYTIEEYTWQTLLYQIALDYKNHNKEKDYFQKLEEYNSYFKNGKTNYEDYYDLVLKNKYLLY